ncbi:transketolase [Ruegeria hyattellae]|uniref:transketolase n=1 Tax=Ruegeria hyattellae TaxID=3233337 RepID=UPI00355BCE0E
MTERSDLNRLADCIRALAIDAVEQSQSGHPGAPMGMADMAAVLYANHLKIDAAHPDWFDRDRVILSNGHASMFLYALLHLTGAPGMSIDEIRNFRQWGSTTPGHPEVGHTPGVETTTGPLGQGLGMAVGFAKAEARMREEFGADICDHRTWVFAGDGCLMEGIGQEAASLAGHLGLGRLNLLYDHNGISIDGSTDLAFTEDTAAKFAALGWHVLHADGHDTYDLDQAMQAAKDELDRPSILLCRTTIGYGSPSKAGSAKSHGAPLGAKDAQAAKAGLGLPPGAFDLPADRVDAWRQIGARGQADHEAWQARVDALPADQKAEFNRRIAGDLPAGFDAAYDAALADLMANPQKVATRKASQIALETLTEAVPELIGGSADLSGSNLTKTASTDTAFSRAGTGRYVNYGVREFAMGAAMNGLALHGGLIPYGGTFLVFSDYMRNAIRLSALMGTRVAYVMTHDSIGLGEDGPTHQPVEHLASLRAIPNLHVFRPADVVETLEAWRIALESRDSPCLLALSRQGVPQLRLTDAGENLTAKGSYVIRDCEGARDVTLIATGTEVALAVEAAEDLAQHGVNAAVVSLPCWSLFDAQSEAYRAEVLGDAPRIAIEAASPFGWARYVGSEDNVIGVRSFGASAPAERLYLEYGITRDAIVTRALDLTKTAN